MIKKGIYLLIGLLIVWAALVATHRGEFWPFSIYPMFSQAGQPWKKFMIHELPPDFTDIAWDMIPENELPGTAFALKNIKLNQNDFSAFIITTEKKQPEKIKAVRDLLQHKAGGKKLLIFRAKGRLAEQNADSVLVEYTPFIFVSPDTTIINPDI